MPPKISVIVPVYNALSHLQLVLAGFSRQTFSDFELIVADDGSGPEVREYIEAFRPRSPFELNYVYQPDEGFRKSRILNAAIRIAAADYLAFVDGDCVPHSRYLEAHWKHLAPRAVLMGRRVNLSEKITNRLTPESVLAGQLEKMKFKLLADSWFGRSSHWDEGVILDSLFLRRFLSRKAPYLLGSAYSLEKSLMEEINGFNEEFVGYGGEDIEFEYRLRLARARFQWVRHQAVQYHLYHKPRSVITANLEIVERTKGLGRPACSKGLRELGTL